MTMVAPYRLGLVADVQYADKDDDVHGGALRYYRQALPKLAAAVDAFNKDRPDSVIHLGDIVDGNDSDASTKADFNAVAREFGRLQMPVHHVVGNHCLDVGREYLLSSLGMQPYYERELTPQWTLLVLDTTDVGLRGASEDLIAQGRAFLAEHEGKLPYAQPWNGGVGAVQLDWLRERLASCRAHGRRAIVVGHMPAWDEAATDMHLVFNHAELVELLDAHADVVALYLAGHYHPGGYARRSSGVHHVTCEGLVEASEGAAAYAHLSIGEHAIEIASADQAGTPGAVTSQQLALGLLSPNAQP